MAEKIVSILTDRSKKLGTGHFQRMLNLLRFLNIQKGIKAFLVKNNKNHIPPGLEQYIIEGVHPKSDLIIRDMRDSHINDIVSLRKISKVLVIDDCGSGRDKADYVIDLLPNTHRDFDKNEYTLEHFIYGFNFSNSIINEKEVFYNKTVDIAFYPGFESSREYIEEIMQYFPEGTRTVLLSGTENYYSTGGQKEKITDKSYSEILLSSKCVAAHFGITLFEAQLCRCRIITINPTDYHNKITSIAEGFIDIINLGKPENLDIKIVKPLISKEINKSHNIRVSCEDVYRTIQKRLFSFYELLLKMISE